MGSSLDVKKRCFGGEFLHHHLYFCLLLLANGKDVKMSPCLHQSFRDRWKFGGKSFDVGLVSYSKLL